MKYAIVVGGANGIGLAISHILAEDNDFDKIIIFDKSNLDSEFNNPKFQYHKFNLLEDNFDVFNQYLEADLLMITAGFGKLSLFKDIKESMIYDSFLVNTIGPIKIIKHFYKRLNSNKPFHCGIMGSISGFMSSPFFSIYASTKAALKIFIESVNIELEKAGSKNRILNVSPGKIPGTSFTNGKTDLSVVKPLAEEIVSHLLSGDDLFIPEYEEIFKNVLERYHNDFRAEGRHSYDYKISSGRVDPNNIS